MKKNIRNLMIKGCMFFCIFFAISRIVNGYFSLEQPLACTCGYMIGTFVCELLERNKE